MPQVYEVQYQINVNSGPALEAIEQFQQATLKLEQLARRFDVVSRSIGKLNAAFKTIPTKPIDVVINTGKAETSLGRVITMMKAIQMHAKGSVSVPNLKELNSAMSQIKSDTQSINRNYIKPKAKTGDAIKSLNALIEKLQVIKSNKNIVITATAAGASRAVSASAAGAAGGAGGAVARPKSTAGRSTLLYPTTRQVLGPVYANTGANVAGEMIKGMGVAYGLSAVMSGIGNVFKEATAYENISQTTKNILGAHDNSDSFESNFNAVNQLMRQVGVETKYTATQVASAGKFLAMAGYNTNEIKESIRPIANLALIGDTDLGETADVVTNIMTGYEIPAHKMNEVADVLTMTFTKSNTTLLELAESFKYVGTVARQSGLAFETSSAAIGVLGDAGIKASHAGTTLRMMLMNMQAPTKKQKEAWQKLGVSPKDQNGNLKDFTSLLSELNKKSKEMSNGDFTSLFYQAFRITAATGAMALVRHADKLREVEELNKKDSFGLSGELAEAKKNTIEGLWYQMTSAFTESGMKSFEAMQEKIKGFLRNLIGLMKSDDFAEGLSSAMKVFLQLANAISDVFKTLVTIWSGIPNWIKDSFVGFVKIQMTLGIISGICKSFMSTALMIRGILWGSWLSGLGKVYLIFQGILHYTKQIYTFSRLLGLGRIAAFGQSVAAGIFRVGAISAGTTMTASATGMAAQGTTFMGALGGLMAHPAAWAMAAAFAIGAIGYKIYDVYQETNKAIEANKKWGASYRKLGVDMLDLSDPNAAIIGNMRIYNNELLTHNQRTVQAIELQKRLWYESKGKKEAPKDGTAFVDSGTDAGNDFKKMITDADNWFGVNRQFESLLHELGGEKGVYNLVRNGKTYESVGIRLGNALISTGHSRINEEDAVQIALAKLGASPQNRTLMDLEQYLIKSVPSAHGYKDYKNIIESAYNRFVPSLSSINPKFDKISSEEAEKMTLSDIESNRFYIYKLRENTERVIKSWNQYGELLRDFESNGSVDVNKVQAFLNTAFGNLFNTKYGLFGSEGYVKYIKDIVNNPKKYGFEHTEQALYSINNSFEKFITFYNGVNSKYQSLFSFFANRTPLEQSLPNEGLKADGGYSGPTKANQTMNIDGVTYTSAFNGALGVWEWRDKKGSTYVPRDNKTKTWAPTSDDGKRGGYKGGGGNNLSKSLHNGSDQSQYKSHYNQSSAPKQVIVRIDNLMRVDKQMIDMTDDRQVAAINNIKQELATALLDVVQDFNSNIV